MSDQLSLRSRRLRACGRACTASSVRASMLHCPVSMPLGTGRKSPVEPLCGQQPALKLLEINPSLGPLSADDHLVLWGASPHLLARLLLQTLPPISALLPWTAGEACQDITHKQRLGSLLLEVGVGGGKWEMGTTPLYFWAIYCLFLLFNSFHTFPSISNSIWPWTLASPFTLECVPRVTEPPKEQLPGLTGRETSSQRGQPITPLLEIKSIVFAF